MLTLLLSCLRLAIQSSHLHPVSFLSSDQSIYRRQICLRILKLQQERRDAADGRKVLHRRRRRFLLVTGFISSASCVDASNVHVAYSTILQAHCTICSWQIQFCLAARCSDSWTMVF